MTDEDDRRTPSTGRSPGNDRSRQQHQSRRKDKYANTRYNSEVRVSGDSMDARDRWRSENGRAPGRRRDRNRDRDRDKDRDRRRRRQRTNESGESAGETPRTLGDRRGGPRTRYVVTEEITSSVERDRGGKARKTSSRQKLLLPPPGYTSPAFPTAAQKEDDRLLFRGVINVLVLVVSAILLVQSGQAAYLYRSRSAFESMARARALLTNGTALSELNSAASLETWLEYQFVPGMLDETSFAQHCDVGAPEFDVPHFWLRGLSRSGRTRGCESPEFWLSRGRRLEWSGVGGESLLLRPGSTAKGIRACAVASDSEIASNGFFLAGAAVGTNCEVYPSTNATSGALNASFPAPTPAPTGPATFDFQCSAGLRFSSCATEPGGKATSCSLARVAGQGGGSDSSDAWELATTYWGERRVWDDATPGDRVQPPAKLEVNATCQAQWTQDKAQVQAAFGRQVAEAWRSLFLRNISHVVIGAHLPLGNDDVVDVAYVVDKGESGLVTTTYFAHVEPSDDIKASILALVNFLLACACPLVCVAILRDFVRFFDNVLCCKGYHPGHLELAAVRLIGCTLGFLLWYELTTRTHLAYADNFATRKDDPQLLDALELLLLVWGLGVFLTDLDVLLTTPMVYLGNFWHLLDMGTVVAVILVLRALTEFDSDESDLRDALKERADTFPAEFLDGVWSEENTYLYMARDPILGALFSALMFLMTIRTARFLALSPALSLPFRTLIAALRELIAFLVVLFLFSTAFAFIFMFSYGGDLPEFAGFGNAITTLFVTLVSDEPLATRFEAAAMGPRAAASGTWAMIIYKLGVGVVFLNMVIAIIFHHYVRLHSATDSSFLLTTINRQRVDKARHRLSHTLHLHGATGGDSDGKPSDSGTVPPRQADEQSARFPPLQQQRYWWETQQPGQYPDSLRQALEHYTHLRATIETQQRANESFVDNMYRELADQAGMVQQLLSSYNSGAPGEHKEAESPTDQQRTTSLPASLDRGRNLGDVNLDEEEEERSQSAGPAHRSTRGDPGVSTDVLFRAALQGDFGERGIGGGGGGGGGGGETLDLDEPSMEPPPPPLYRDRSSRSAKSGRSARTNQAVVSEESPMPPSPPILGPHAVSIRSDRMDFDDLTPHGLPPVEEQIEFSRVRSQQNRGAKDRGGRNAGGGGGGGGGGVIYHSTPTLQNLQVGSELQRGNSQS